MRFDLFFRACRDLCGMYKSRSVDGDLSLTSRKALVYLKPKRIAIRNGYFGVHNTIQVYRKINPAVVSGKWLRLCWIDQIINPLKELIDLDDEYREGDIVWFESPLNPTGEVR